jgi:hypothetical protein
MWSSVHVKAAPLGRWPSSKKSERCDGEEGQKSAGEAKKGRTSMEAFREKPRAFPTKIGGHALSLWALCCIAP